MDLTHKPAGLYATRSPQLDSWSAQKGQSKANRPTGQSLGDIEPLSRRDFELVLGAFRKFRARDARMLGSAS